VVLDVDPAAAVVDVVSGSDVSGAAVSGTVVLVLVPVAGAVVDDDGVVVTVVELDGSVVVDVESATALPAVRASAAVATTRKVTRR
jgi:uncharacterized protein GlcG (DUF336 family)